jgi:TRAP transporter TAXI family solute receptor
MKKLFVAVVLLTVLVLPVVAGGQDEQPVAPAMQEQPAGEELGPVSLKFGAMPVGSSWYIYAATYTKLFEGVFPEGSAFEVIPQGGGIANPLAVAQGKADVALSNVATARWAYDGIEMYEGKQAKNIRGIAGGLSKVWMVVMFKEEFIEKTGMDSLEKIAANKYPVRVICKPEGSTVPPVARMILSEYGMSFDKIKEWGGEVIQVSGGQIPALVRDGRADVWFESAVNGHPATTEGMLTANLRMVGLSDSVIKALENYGLYEDTMPAGLFHNQDEPIRTVMPGTSIIANENLPEEAAYLIAKTICENKDELVAAHASIKVFEPEKAWTSANNGIPLHPGAERYYRERGWLK